MFFPNLQKRLWQACSLRCFPHRVSFIRNNLHYENIIWHHPSKTNDYYWDIYQNVIDLLNCFNSSLNINEAAMYEILQGLFKMFHTRRRILPIYLPCGIKAIDASLVDISLKKWCNNVVLKIKNKNKNLLEDLLFLEIIAPCINFNASIARVAWNICRLNIGQSCAFIPWQKKEDYYKILQANLKNMFSIQNMPY